jgi:hypothetical protein
VNATFLIVMVDAVPPDAEEPEDDDEPDAGDDAPGPPFAR